MGVISIILIVMFVAISIIHLRFIGMMGAVKEAIVTGSAMCSFILAVTLYVLFEDLVEASQVPQSIFILLLCVVSCGFFGLLYCIAERQNKRHVMHDCSSQPRHLSHRQLNPEPKHFSHR